MDMYDKEGDPLTIEEWGPLLEDQDYKRVGLTEVGPYEISTVWLGLDHRFGEGPPLIFETMVFTASAWHADRSDPDREGLHDLDCRRYATLEEAERGHEEMVTLIRATTMTSPPCKECGGEVDVSNPHSGYGMCAGCLHDALRSGWSPGD